jgi:tetratricopeptide (TPR) repeat protein
VPGAAPGPLADQGAALAWLTAEYRVLLAFVDRLAGSGSDRLAWQLAWTLDTFQRRQGHRHDHVATRRTALVAARRLADPAMLADTHRDLGHALCDAERADEARTHFTCAIDGSVELGDLAGQAHAERGIAATYLLSGQYDKTLLHCLRAEELYRAAGHRLGVAKALNEAGFMHARLGEHRAALERCERALALFRELGDRHGEAACLDRLGLVHDALDERGPAAECFARSAELFADAGDRHAEATALVNLGDVHRRDGAAGAARAAWRSALGILEELRRPEAEEVRARLA